MEVKSKMKESNQWHYKWRRPHDTLRFDKDSAVSKAAPAFFHIKGVPRATGKAGGLIYDYDHGKWNVGRVRTGESTHRPRTSKNFKQTKRFERSTTQRKEIKTIRS